MAEGGTLKSKLEQIQKDLDAEQKLWTDQQLPPIGMMWRMNETEFQHHCHTEAFFRILKDHLGVSQEICDLYYKTVVLDELQKARPAVEAAKRDALRKAITDGIRPVV